MNSWLIAGVVLTLLGNFLYAKGGGFERIHPTDPFNPNIRPIGRIGNWLRGIGGAILFILAIGWMMDHYHGGSRPPGAVPFHPGGVVH